MTVGRTQPGPELRGTVSPRDAAARAWDAIIVGAGPAGAMAAQGLARRGASVLLVDLAVFPRAKVCGCCLSAAAVSALHGQGLGPRLSECGAVPLRAVRLAAGARRVEVAIAGGAALSRASLDAMLVMCAIGAGVAFLPGVSAAAQAVKPGDPCAAVELSCGGTPRARMLLAADGLGGGCLARVPGLEVRRRHGSNIGLAAIVEEPSALYPPGAIHMHCAGGAYLGLVRLEDGRLNAAAAISPARVRAAGGTGTAASAILRQAGMPAVAALATAHWHGTPLLTARRARVEQGPILVVGDAAGYVEPFTGEGMAWALECGMAAARIAAARLAGTSAPGDAAWAREHERLVRWRQRLCGAVAWALRRPRLVGAAARVLERWPGAATPLLRSIRWPPPAAAGIGRVA